MDYSKYFKEMEYYPFSKAFDKETGNVKFNTSIKLPIDDENEDKKFSDPEEFSKEMLREKYNEIKRLNYLKSRPEILSKEIALGLKGMTEEGPEENSEDTLLDKLKRKAMQVAGNHPKLIEKGFNKIASIQGDYKEKGLENTYLTHMRKGALTGAGLGLAGLVGYDVLEMPFTDDPTIPLTGDSPYTIGAVSGLGALAGAGINGILTKGILSDKINVPDLYNDEIPTRDKKDYEDIKNTADYNYQNNIFDPEKRKQSELEKKLNTFKKNNENQEESKKEPKEETTLSDLISKRYHKLLEN